MECFQSKVSARTWALHTCPWLLLHSSSKPMCKCCLSGMQAGASLGPHLICEFARGQPPFQRVPLCLLIPLQVQALTPADVKPRHLREQMKHVVPLQFLYCRYTLSHSPPRIQPCHLQEQEKRVFCYSGVAAGADCHVAHPKSSPATCRIPKKVSSRWHRIGWAAGTGSQ